MDALSHISKQELRDQCQKRRAGLSLEAAEAAVVRVAEQVAALVSSYAPAVVACYQPVRGELNIQPASQMLAEQGFTLCLPVAVHRDRPLLFRRWRPETVLRKGRYGIMEPPETEPEMAPDVALVPVLAFDATGGRLGYGAGYYDRTLRQLREQRRIAGEGAPLCIGVAYAVQQVDRVPLEAHDERLDAVVTELGVMRFG